MWMGEQRGDDSAGGGSLQMRHMDPICFMAAYGYRHKPSGMGIRLGDELST